MVSTGNILIYIFVHLSFSFFFINPYSPTCYIFRTGFLVCSYLIQEEGWGIEEAINAFAISKPPVSITSLSQKRVVWYARTHIQYTPMAPLISIHVN
jgi:hypothetical protein